MRKQISTLPHAGDTVVRKKLSLVFHVDYRFIPGGWLEIKQSQRVTNSKKGLGSKVEVLGMPMLKGLALACEAREGRRKVVQTEGEF